MRIAFFLAIIAFAFSNCDQSTTATTAGNETATIDKIAADLDTVNYIYESIPDTDIQLVKLIDGEGNIQESGMMLNGHKVGTWTYNHPGTNYPKTITSFVNDVRNGPYFELNDRGQTTIMAYYKNNKLHGPWAKFRYGKAEMSVNYTEGKMNGIYREVDFKNGQLQKEISFKNGKEDGFMRYYDDKGNVTVEYIYKNGEKISGGMVNK